MMLFFIVIIILFACSKQLIECMEENDAVKKLIFLQLVDSCATVVLLVHTIASDVEYKHNNKYVCSNLNTH